MQRTNPCFYCGATETSIAYGSDPWCSVNCQKQIARLIGLLDDQLHPAEFTSALNRLRESGRKARLITPGPRRPIEYSINEIGKEIVRGRNWREVYGTQDLLREAEGRVNGRRIPMRFKTGSGFLPRVR